MTTLGDASRKSLDVFFTSTNTIKNAALYTHSELRAAASENATTFVRTLCITGENLAKTTASAASSCGEVAADAFANVPIVGVVAVFCARAGAGAIALGATGFAAAFESADIILHLARTETKRNSNQP